MILQPIDPATALYVASNMRAADAEEIFATREVEDPAQLAADAAACQPFGWTAGLDSPIACIGASPMWPGVFQMWMFATDDFSRISLSLTKFVLRDMIPAMKRAGAHRGHCYSIETHSTAHRWLEALGAEHKVDLDGWGKRGESFRLYQWRA